jgi:uncharacterized delta-60 repeat protein
LTTSLFVEQFTRQGRIEHRKLKSNNEGRSRLNPGFEHQSIFDRVLRENSQIRWSKIFLVFQVIALVCTSNAAPPTIQYHPRDQAVAFHQQATFGVVAEGTKPLSYQWYKNGMAIPAATTDQVILSQPEFPDAGQYSVTVSNAEGNVTSTNATLVVKAPKAGDLDYSFLWGGSIYGIIQATALQPDGKIIIGGVFTTVNGAIRGNIARLNSDGTTDYTFMNGMAGADAAVYAVATQPDGRILIGGSFTNVTGVPRNHIARLNADGSLDTAFLDGETGVDKDVYAIAVQPDGNILIGGAFNSVDGLGIGPMARLNPDGSTDTFFQPRTCCYVYSIALQSDGKIVIGGEFSSINSVPRQLIARLTTDGEVDASFQNGLAGASYPIRAIAIQPDGKILIGGGFITSGGTRRRIARLNSDGTLDSGFLSSGGSADNTVYSIAVKPNGKILVGGIFNNINGVTKRAIAQLSQDGSADTNFQAVILPAGYHPGSDVYAISIESDGKAFIAGAFETLDGSSTPSIGKINQDGSRDGSFQTRSRGPNYDVRAFAQLAGGSWLVGGTFSIVDGSFQNLLLRLRADGMVDPTFGNGGMGIGGNNATVLAIALQDDGKPIVGGAFNSAAGIGHTNIARLNTDGTLDPGFANTSIDGTVQAVTLQLDGKILVGGYFMKVNSTTRNFIARLNADGTLDTTFKNGLKGGNNTVYSFAPLATGKILIAGAFSTFNGTNRHNIARLNADGSLDFTFQNGLSGVNGSIYTMTVQADGKILIAGDYSSVNGTNRLRIARLNSDGTLDPTFLNGMAGVNGIIFSLLAQPDGRILIGGRFTSVNGVSCDRIARLNSDGSLDTAFSARVFSPDPANTYVGSMAIQNDGKIMIGGLFTAVNNGPASFIARLWGTQSPFIQHLEVLGSTATITLSLPPGTTNRVQYKNQLTDSSWIDLPGDIAATGFDQLTNKVDTSTGTTTSRYYRIWQWP